MTRRWWEQAGLNFGQEAGRASERTGKLEAERDVKGVNYAEMAAVDRRGEKE